MEECKKEQSRADPFIRAVKAAPEAMCVLARDRQLNDMARFCTDDQQFSVVGVDPTFNLGEFSVTVTTYRHLQLIHRQTNKHPVLLGSNACTPEQNFRIILLSGINCCWSLTTTELSDCFWNRWRANPR